MKTLIASFVALLVGVLAGWFIEHRHAEREMTSVVEQMQQPIEASDRLEAVRAMRAIQMIQSGESSNAVQFLSRPIGDFYRTYASLTHNDERTKQTLALVEQVASTNIVVADEIHRKIQ